MIDTSSRSKEIEIMDDFDMTGETLIKTLDQIARINQLLGGNAVTLSGLKSLLKDWPKNKQMTIVDLGCGNGDMLRAIADYGKKKAYRFVLIGIDANAFTLNYAEALSGDYPEISYVQKDILASDYDGISCDVVLSTLFLHHFTDKEIDRLLSQHLKKARLAVLVNDLHRHRLAYYLFKLIALGIQNKMVKNDGLISILRGFKRKELENFSTQLACETSIKWKWAFRYQYMLKKNSETIA